MSSRTPSIFPASPLPSSRARAGHLRRRLLGRRPQRPDQALPERTARARHRAKGALEVVRPTGLILDPSEGLASLRRETDSLGAQPHLGQGGLGRPAHLTAYGTLWRLRQQRRRLEVEALLRERAKQLALPKAPRTGRNRVRKPAVVPTLWGPLRESTGLVRASSGRRDHLGQTGQESAALAEAGRAGKVVGSSTRLAPLTVWRPSHLGQSRRLPAPVGYQSQLVRVVSASSLHPWRADAERLRRQQRVQTFLRSRRSGFRRRTLARGTARSLRLDALLPLLQKGQLGRLRHWLRLGWTQRRERGRPHSLPQPVIRPAGRRVPGPVHLLPRRKPVVARGPVLSGRKALLLPKPAPTAAAALGSVDRENWFAVVAEALSPEGRKVGTRFVNRKGPQRRVRTRSAEKPATRLAPRRALRGEWLRAASQESVSAVADFQTISTTRKPSEKWAALVERRRTGAGGSGGSGGRNHHGHITTYHRGGGHKRRHRRVELGYGEDGWRGVIRAFRYDPNRSARLALVETTLRARTGGLLSRSLGETFRLVPATLGTQVGTVIHYGGRPSSRSLALEDWRTRWERLEAAGQDLQEGSIVPLSRVPSHRAVHGIEIRPWSGSTLVRTGGSFGTVVNRTEEGWVRVQLPSGEHRLFPGDSRCVLGTVLGESHYWTQGSAKAGGVARRPEGWSSSPRPRPWPKGKAGRTRWLSRRPTVRGTARNPVDHPHGGGQGKTSGGRPSVTPWSKPKGARTSSGAAKPFVVVSRHRRP